VVWSGEITLNYFFFLLIFLSHFIPYKSDNYVHVTFESIYFSGIALCK